MNRIITKHKTATFDLSEDGGVLKGVRAGFEVGKPADILLSLNNNDKVFPRSIALSIGLLELHNLINQLSNIRDEIVKLKNENY